jgi:hypothetical protein
VAVSDYLHALHSRQALMVLTNVGLSKLVAKTPERYV